MNGVGFFAAAVVIPLVAFRKFSLKIFDNCKLSVNEVFQLVSIK